MTIMTALFALIEVTAASTLGPRRRIGGSVRLPIEMRTSQYFVLHCKSAPDDEAPLTEYVVTSSADATQVSIQYLGVL